MKPGTRALGIAVSDGDRRAVVGGAVVRRDRATDGFALADCTVGGLDATAAVRTLLSDLAREDVQYLLVAGVAPAWFNLLDLDAIHETSGVPTLAVSFEDSPGLRDAISREFDGDAARERLAVYERLPDRHAVRVGSGATERTVWVRAVGCEPDRAASVVRAYTPDGSGRPEPLRVARLLARAGRAFHE